MDRRKEEMGMLQSQSLTNINLLYMIYSQPLPRCARGGRCIYRLGERCHLKLPPNKRGKEKPSVEHTKLVCLVSTSS